MNQEQIAEAGRLSFLARKGYRGANIQEPWRQFQGSCDHMRPDGTSNLRRIGNVTGCDICSQLFRDGVRIR